MNRVIPSRSPTPISQRLLNLSFPAGPAGHWRCLLKRGTILLGVGFGLIHFPFSSHAPVSKGTGVCLLDKEAAGQAAQDAADEVQKKILLDMYPI